MISRRRIASAQSLLIAVPLAAALFAPLVASAAAVAAPNIWPAGWWAPNGVVSCTGNYLPSNTSAAGTGSVQVASKPPCTSLNDLEQTVINVIYLSMSIAIFIVAPIMFLVGAIMIILAGANPGLLSQGRKLMTGTAIGLVLILCSYLIISTVIGVFNISGIGGFSGS